MVTLCLSFDWFPTCYISGNIPQFDRICNSGEQVVNQEDDGDNFCVIKQ